MVNFVVVGGRLTKEVELQKSKSGRTYCTFMLACNRPLYNNAPAQVDYFYCIAWESVARYIKHSCSQGDVMIVTGKLQNVKKKDKPSDKDQITVTSIDRWADNEEGKYHNLTEDDFVVTPEDF